MMTRNNGFRPRLRICYTESMPQIRFKRNRPALDVPAGANLMKALQEAGVPVASSCRGDGICAKCRIEIVEGQANLTKPNDREKYLAERFRVPSSDRVSCQVEVLGDVTVDTTYW